MESCPAVIKVGQNARGEWAWIVTANGEHVASGEACRFAEVAQLLARAAEDAYRAAGELKGLADGITIDPPASDF